MESVEFLGRYRLTQSDACFKLGRDSVLLAGFAPCAPGGRCVTWAVGWAPSCFCCPSGRRPWTGWGWSWTLSRPAWPAEPVGQRLGGTSSYRRPPGPRPAEGRPLPADDCHPPIFGRGPASRGDRPGWTTPAGGRPVPGRQGVWPRQGGRFALVYRPERLAELFAALRGARWNPSGFSCCPMGPPAPLTRFWWRR